MPVRIDLARDLLRVRGFVGVRRVVRTLRILVARQIRRGCATARVVAAILLRRVGGLWGRRGTFVRVGSVRVGIRGVRRRILRIVAARRLLRPGVAVLVCDRILRRIRLFFRVCAILLGEPGRIVRDVGRRFLRRIGRGRRMRVRVLIGGWHVGRRRILTVALAVRGDQVGIVGIGLGEHVEVGDFFLVEVVWLRLRFRNLRELGLVGVRGFLDRSRELGIVRFGVVELAIEAVGEQRDGLGDTDLGVGMLADLRALAG